MKVYAWLIDFAHFWGNCPTDMIPEWRRKVTWHNGIVQVFFCHSNVKIFFLSGIRRKINYLASSTPRQVVIRRQPMEGFGFVIISSTARNQPTAGHPNGSLAMQTNYPVLGRILEDSPAQRSGELHVGDKILAGGFCTSWRIWVAPVRDSNIFIFS